MPSTHSDQWKALQTINGMKRVLRSVPVTLGRKVALRVAPHFTLETQRAYDSGRDVYGDARPRGVGGQPLTLHDTGDTRRDAHFIAFGTIVRARLGPHYARYLIGKYRILPNGRIPAQWSVAIDRIMQEEMRAAMRALPQGRVA